MTYDLDCLHRTQRAMIAALYYDAGRCLVMADEAPDVAWALEAASYAIERVAREMEAAL